VTEPPSPGTSSGANPGSDPAQAWDEQQWRRPAAGQESHPPPIPPSEPVYTGPPRADAAAAKWRPRTVLQVAPARRLPPQDDAVIDAREHQARTVTYGVGMIAGAVAVIVLIVLCGRVLF
jgi:hypothetical protein